MESPAKGKLCSTHKLSKRLAALLNGEEIKFCPEQANLVSEWKKFIVVVVVAVEEMKKKDA